MKQLIAGMAAAFALTGCTDDQPFVKHVLLAEKLGACTSPLPKIQMTSNTLGERYVFNACLPDGYKSDSHTMTRNGDTLFFGFGATAGATTLYRLTLQVDAKPRYHFIKLGEELLTITAGTY